MYIHVMVNIVLNLFLQVVGVTMGTPLPLFSSRVSRCLTEGQSKIVWSLLVNEAAGYYLENFPDIGSRQEYTAIGRKMLAQYPCIRTEGNEGWVCISKM